MKGCTHEYKRSPAHLHALEHVSPTLILDVVDEMLENWTWKVLALGMPEPTVRTCPARAGCQSSPMVPRDGGLLSCPHQGDSLKSVAHRQGGPSITVG